MKKILLSTLFACLLSLSLKNTSRYSWLPLQFTRGYGQSIPFIQNVFISDADFDANRAYAARGLVYEELAEMGGEKAQVYAGLAYDDLSQDEWFSRLEPQRLERLMLLRDGKR